MSQKPESSQKPETLASEHTEMIRDVRLHGAKTAQIYLDSIQKDRWRLQDMRVLQELSHQLREIADESESTSEEDTS